MAKSLPQNLTELANNAQKDPDAAREFLSAVYQVMREIAQRQANDRPAAGEGATEVANEVAADFLTVQSPTVFVNRQQVLSGLVTRIGHKVIDLAKRRRRGKRGGKATHVPIDSPAAAGHSSPVPHSVDSIAVEEAFSQLQTQHPNAYQVLQLRNAGHTVQEVADTLDVSPKTVVRWTKFGTAFLYGQLSGSKEARQP